MAAYQDRLKKTDETARARLVLGNSPEGDFEDEQEYFETTWKAYERFETSEEQVCMASLRWLMDRHLARKIIKGIDPKAELQAHLDRIKKVEEFAKLRFDVGKSTVAEYKTATFFRLQAEEWLAQGKTFEKSVVPVPSSK